MTGGIGIRGAKRGVGETKSMVLQLDREGLSAREIAAEVGISTQAVYAHLADLRTSGLLEEGTA